MSQWQRKTDLKREEISSSFIDGLSHIGISSLFHGETKLAEAVSKYQEKAWVSVDSLDFDAAKADKKLLMHLKEDYLFDVFLDREWYPATALAVLALIHHKGKIILKSSSA